MVAAPRYLRTFVGADADDRLPMADGLVQHTSRQVCEAMTQGCRSRGCREDFFPKPFVA